MKWRERVVWILALLLIAAGLYTLQDWRLSVLEKDQQEMRELLDEHEPKLEEIRTILQEATWHLRQYASRESILQRFAEQLASDEEVTE